MSVMKILKKFDLFELRISPSIKGNSSHKTFIGGFLSIILIILSILCAFAFGNDFLYKSNPLILSSEALIQYPITSSKSILFAIAPNGFGGITFNNIEKDFSFNLQVFEKEDGPAKMKLYDLVKCNETKLFKENINNIKNHLIPNADSYYCLGDNVDIPDLKSKIGSLGSVNYIIQMVYCKGKEICNNIDDIKNRYKQFYYHVIISDSYVDSNNYISPISPTYSTYMFLVSTINPRRDTISLKRISITSDNGALLENMIEYNGYSIESLQTEINFNPEANEISRTIITHQLKKFILKRVYLKIQTIAANIGGFTKFCTIIFLFISKKYSTFEYFKKLNENLKKKIKNFPSNSNSLYGTINIKEKEKINNFLDSKNKSKDENKNIKNNIISISNYSPIIYINSKNEERFLFLRYIFFFCKNKKSKSIQQITNVKEYFFKYFEVERIFLTCKETELTNSCLFSRNKLDNIVKKSIFQEYMSENNINFYKINDEMINIRK